MRNLLHGAARPSKARRRPAIAPKACLRLASAPFPRRDFIGYRQLRQAPPAHEQELDAQRDAQGRPELVGKVVVAVLFGFLIVGFAIWGIGDIFRGAPRTTVAKVGDAEITAEQFRTAYQAELQQLIRAARGSRSRREQARAFGLDQPGAVAPGHRGGARPDGARARPQRLRPARRRGRSPRSRAFKGAERPVRPRRASTRSCASNGLTEAGFVREQRRRARAPAARRCARRRAAGAARRPRGGAPLRRERRTRRLFRRCRGQRAGEIPAPTRRAARRPSTTSARRRSARRNTAPLNVVALDRRDAGQARGGVGRRRPPALRAGQGARFGTPERRTIQQIVFPTAAGGGGGASTGSRRARPSRRSRRSGTSPPQDLELGTFAKREMIDPAVADAAFALAQGAVSAPVQGRFGAVLVRVRRSSPRA